ncbi:hypothetical protein GLV89_14230 [Halomonas alkaliantarctica]|nr:hypothetical protein [Halomonas alkaliantarctica]
MSVIGQQNLRESQNTLQTSMERLSSGLRINSANDGISAAQTAEGGLNQVNDNLQRIRELTVQAQNGTNSENDLTSIQDEIDRISGQTDFNGTKVLSETTDLNIQVGANDDEQIAIKVKEITVNSLELEGFTVEENAVRAGDGSGTNEVAVDLSEWSS